MVLATGDMDSILWFLDSGASSHATPCQSAFINYHKGMFGKFFLGDNKECDIVGKGDILLSLKNDSKWILKDVKHFPTLTSNLILVNQLYTQGYT